MPHLFTLPGPRNGPDTISTWFTPEAGSHYIVDAGTIIYASLRRVLWADHNEIDFTNHGTIWNIAPGEPSYGGGAVAGFYINNIVNTGTIIAEAPFGNASAIFVGSLADSVNNSGSIYAIANGNAEAITHWSPDVVITNSGLIVAYAPSATPGTGGGGVGSALGIWLVNDGFVHNLAGGRILAEGLYATGVNLGRGSLYGRETLQNDGLIEAYSLVPGRPSVGIAAGGDFQFSHHFYNTGIVRADIAWSSASPPDVYYGYAPKAPDTIVNETGGLLVGDIETGFGTDQVINRGRIEGDLRLGDESDVFNTELGSFAGVADLGWHDDVFRGSAGTDICRGNRGADDLRGNGGNDLLLGGVGGDVLIGGAGNDALYGEYGNDRIETEGGDNAYGGDGGDLIVASDMTFRLIDGGAGADTLRLTVGARNLDLGTAIASGRLQSIEHIELQSSQQLAVRAGNVAALAGGALDITGSSANQVHLVGGWTEGAAIVRGGETWRSFTLAGENVFVTGGISVLTDAAEPGFAGLDAVAAGDVPLPAGAELSSNVLNISYFDVHVRTVIEAEEVWQWTNAPVIMSYDQFGLVNHGTILMTSNNVIGYFQAAVQGQSLGKCENSGTIRTVATGNNESAAFNVSGYAALENTGLIEAIAVGAQAQACGVVGGFVNHGAIVAKSVTGLACGVIYNGGSAALNTGRIEATGGAATVGLRLGGAVPFVNEGTIVAQNTAISGAHDALAVQLYIGSLDNRGTITGVVAIWSDFRADVVTNSGRITGDILMNAGDDRLTNNGEIVGTIDLGAGNDVYDGAGSTARAVVNAGAGDDSLTGGAFADVLDGGAGTDSMAGGAGDDSYFVDSAADIVIEHGGEGRDTVFAFDSYALGAQPHVENLSAASLASTNSMNLTGNGLANDIFGNAGANVLIGEGGADTLTGGAGNDIYRVEEAGDIVVEATGGGSDAVYAVNSYMLGTGSEVELLSAIDPGLAVAMDLTGNEFANFIYGTAGSNTLIGGGGADTLIGGGGNDFYRVEEAGDRIVEAAGGGSDAVYAVVSYTLAAGSEIELLSAIDPGSAGAMDLTGNEYGNRLYGTAGVNVLIGGGGADVLLGGAGNDFYRVEEAGDVVVEAAGGGADSVYAVTSYTLAAGSEVELLSAIDPAAASAMDLTGNEYANRLYGNAGGNVLIGGGGADILFGGADNDVYRVEEAGDIVVESVGGGADSIYAVTSYTLAAGSEVELLSAIDPASAAAMDLTGNEYANRLYGNAGVNLLDGKSGNDVLTGGAGADFFAFTTLLGAGNVDMVADFTAGTDKIRLDDAVFTAIGGLGTLAASAFVIGSAAADADDRIVYNNATGQLFYDADGSGGGAAIWFATLQSAPALSASDFQVI